MIRFKAVILTIIPFFCSPVYFKLLQSWFGTLYIMLLCIFHFDMCEIFFSWWEGVVVERSKKDGNTLTVQFPGMYNWLL